MHFGVKSIVAIIFVVGLLCQGCSKNDKCPLESIICVGMPLQMVRTSLDREGLVPWQMNFPKEPDSWKRYEFTEKYSLLLVSKWEDVGGRTDKLQQKVIEKIRLVPNRHEEGKPSYTLKVHIVDLHKKVFR